MAPVILPELREIDNLREGELDGCPVYAHDEHRFVLPILFEAQRRRHLPQPCKLIMFDAHHDALLPRKQEAHDRIAALRASGFTRQELLDLCARDLSLRDDDWVTAGMAMGLLSDALIFGVDDRLTQASITGPSLRLRSPSWAEFHGPDRVVHQIHMHGFPGEELGDHGDLGDHARAQELAPFWRALDWDHRRPTGFGDSGGPVLLDIDLDAFVIDWKEFVLPWPDEVFRGRFLRPSGRGWTGRRFFDALVKHTGTIAIAREPKQCGGLEKSQQVWHQVNRFLFDNRLSVS